MDWVAVRRRTKSRTQQQSRRKVKVLVKVDGSRAITMDVALSDKVSDVVTQIPNGVCGSESDVCGTSGGRGPGRGEGLRCCRVSDGSTVQVMSRMLGEGRRRIPCRCRG